MKPLWLALALDGGVRVLRGATLCTWPPLEEDVSLDTGGGLLLMQLGPAMGRQGGRGRDQPPPPPGLWNQEPLPAAGGGWHVVDGFERPREKPSYLEALQSVEKSPSELQEGAMAIQRRIQSSILQENSRLHQENSDVLEVTTRVLQEANRSRARERALQEENARLEGQITQLYRQNVELRRRADASASSSTSLLQHLAAIPLIPRDKTGIFFVTMTFIGLTVLSMCAFQAYCAANPSNRERPTSYDDADWAHIHEHMESRNTTGLVQGREEVRILILLFGFVTVGFCALWWMGIMQPFVKQLLLYTYLAMAVLMLLSIILAPASGVLYMILSVLVGIVTRIDEIFSFTLAEARAFKRLAMPSGPRSRPGPKATAKSGARPSPRADAGRSVCVCM